MDAYARFQAALADDPELAAAHAESRASTNERRLRRRAHLLTAAAAHPDLNVPRGQASAA